MLAIRAKNHKPGKTNKGLKATIMVYKHLLLSFIFIHTTIGCSASNLTYSGTFTNTSFQKIGIVTFNLQIQPDNKISGYINFSGYPNGNVLCGAGNFAGIKRNDSIYFSFISNDTDAGCGFDYGFLFSAGAAYVNGYDSIEGKYYIANGQQGVFHLGLVNRPAFVGGVKENNYGHAFSFHFNPANTRLIITDAETTAQTITIYNEAGQKLAEQKFAEEIDISSLNRGTYFIEVSGGPNIAWQKFEKL